LVPIRVHLLFYGEGQVTQISPEMAERAVEPIRKVVDPLVVAMILITMGFGYGAARVFGLPMPRASMSRGNRWVYEIG
jgi:multisubunit Na+/H+ antiporter MnhC subunit